MIAYSNAKINIGLNIRDKRPDGYHNIESLFYPIPLCDLIEIIPGHKDSFMNTGIQIDHQNNLILDAIALIREHYPIPPLYVHVHKAILLGSGLGGGSSNASHTLIILNRLFDLQISNDLLAEFALQLGSDCPFFIHNKPSIVKGRGEFVSPIEFTLKDQFIKLVFSDIHSSTADAFSNLNIESDQEFSIDENWPKTVSNDFEKGIFKVYPQLGQIKSQLIEDGAYFASLTGTGSCVYGIYENQPIISSSKERVFKL